MSNILKSTAWHTKNYDEVFKLLSTSKQGLSVKEVEKRLENYGLNQLPQAKSKSVLVRFLLQFNNVLIYVLLAAFVVTSILGHWIDAGVILGVVVINAIIGFIQEGKAENALKAIKRMLSLSAKVTRENKQKTIDAKELVLGDVVFLQSGDKVPADLRLFKTNNLQAQEAILTGESLPVSKNTSKVKGKTAIGDRKCMAYSGTLITQGQALGIVVATGIDTELGHISKLVTEVETLTTPLLRQISQFSIWLTIAILVIASISFIFGVFIRDYSISDMFLASISLSVAAIPEGLPAIITITLAIGVQRMAKRNAIIRQLPAVETLGAVSVICSDKTGTITCNEMTVKNIVTANNKYSVEGTGYNDKGSICLNDNDIALDQHPALATALNAALLCNDASLEKKQQETIVSGDPMEGALLVSGLKAGIDLKNQNKQYPRIDIIPFESENRFMATLNSNHHADENIIFIKGAPEKILKMCDKQQIGNTNTSLNKNYWFKKIDKMASKGQRVLAVAKKNIKDDKHLNFKDIENSCTMIALFGLIDPPREDAIKGVAECNSAGIRVKMITGDYGATASAIAKQLNLNNTFDVITSNDIENMSRDELAKKVEYVDIYARISPEHKLLLVTLLQEHNLIVAMTGDGVNDAPALKRSDVGTAMGINGSEASKEAADMVLADDNFISISHAIEEGRTVYDNIKKAIIFILPTNGGEALVIIAAILLGFTDLPLTPIQILWVNMITAVTLALAIAFEPSEDNVMLRQPRNSKEPILSKYLIWRIAFVSVILMIGTFSFFTWDISQGNSLEHARTIAVNTLVMYEIFYLFNSRYINASVLNIRGFIGNKYALLAIFLLIIFQLIFTYVEFAQFLFGTTSIEAITWLYIVLVASSVLFLVELEKFIVSKFRKTT